MTLLELYSANRFHEIIAHFESQPSFVVEDNPAESNVLAAAYFKSQEFEKAYKILQSLESALYTNPEFLSLFGATCRCLMLYDQARSLFLRAIDLQPDSMQLKNNYANLLIDIGDPQGAISLLRPIVQSNPNYADALQNLDRAQSLLQATTLPSPTSVSSAASSDIWDPMTLAFSTDEVLEFGRVKKNLKVSSSAKEFDSSLPTVSLDALSSDYLKLAKQAINEKNYSLALEYCTKIHSMSSPISATYSTSFDAYVALKQFHKAEISLLTSMLLSEPSCSQYLNLSSLASIRKDFKLAYLYLDKASSLDPSDPMVSKIRSNIDKLSVQKTDFNFCAEWPINVQ